MQIIRFLQSFSCPFLDNFFQAVTMLGEEYFYIVMLALVFWCIDKRYGYKLSFAFLLSGVVNGTAKSLVDAKRPIGTEGIRSLRIETATGSSFPSGHTQNITSFSVSVMKQLRRGWVTAVGCVLILLVGASRLYLGLHWPLDVLGGLLLGAGCIFLADFLFEAAERRQKKHLLVLLAVPALAVAIIWSDFPDLVKTAATFCGFLAGYLIEDRFIGYDSKAPFFKQVVKFALGIAVTLGLKEGLKIAFPELAVFDFLRYLILGLWITVGAPLVFKALRLSASVPKAQDHSISA